MEKVKVIKKKSLQNQTSNSLTHVSPAEDINKYFVYFPNSDIINLTGIIYYDSHRFSFSIFNINCIGDEQNLNIYIH